MENTTTKPIGFCWYSFEGVAPDWASKMNAYTVSIWRDNRDNFKDFQYFMGVGLNSDPQKEDVLECLIFEWQMVEETGWDFMEWVETFGTGETKTDWNTYKAITENSKKLLELFTNKELLEILNSFQFQDNV